MLKNDDPALYKSFLAAKECHQRGDLLGAEAIYSRLLALDPADDEVLYLFGCLKASKGDLDVGVECLRLAQQLKPDSVQIPYTLGVVLQEAERIVEAAEAYRTAVAIDPTYIVAWENLCAAYYDLDDYVSGLAAAQKALVLNRESLLAIRGAANCLAALGRRREALEILNTGLNYHPALPELRIHHSWELMANGRYAEAWYELEWRHSYKGRSDPVPRSVPYPRWNGEPLMGKTILVYGEQGIGDEVMYAPFVLGVVRAGGKCLLECEPRLEQPFARAFPDCTILRRESRDEIPWYAGMPKVDYCVPALSLPLYFQHPLDRRAFLTAAPERTRYWRKRLESIGHGLKIGVSWRGGADAKARKIRSIPEKIFGEIIDERAMFVSLQYGATAVHAAEVSPSLVHFPEIDPLTDLEEFFALVSALDAVVSVDNSTVHFSGALGVKTLLLLPVYSEWRWGNQASGMSPWYQSLELIRQTEASEQGWRNLLQEAREWLEKIQPAAPELSGDKVASKFVGLADVLSVPGRGCSALLIADTNYWYHWGSSCTSLGLHEGLRTRFENISVLPMARLQSGCPTSFSVESLDSSEFFSRFSQACPDILNAMKMVDYVIINGGGDIRGETVLSLLLLYLAYIAKHRLNKQVAVVNHSCVPGDAPVVNDYYAKVYRCLDIAVVRERFSLENVSNFGGRVALGFDCLPLFLAKHNFARGGNRRKKLVLGGAVIWSQEMVDYLVSLAVWASAEGFSVEVLSGAKAFLGVEEIAFVEKLVRSLDEKRIAHSLRFPISEMEWLDAIGTASLVVSGRVHDLIAAAFQKVPLVAMEDGSQEMRLITGSLGQDSVMAATDHDAYDLLLERAKDLLTGTAVWNVDVEQLDNLSALAQNNFLVLFSNESPSVKTTFSPSEDQFSSKEPSEKQKRLIALYSQMAKAGYQTVDGQQIDVAFSDMEIKAFKDVVKPLFQKFSVKSMLDYGCGGSDYDVPGFGSADTTARLFFGLNEVYRYEPARGLDQRQISDAVVCFDVLEHVFVADIPRVVREVFSLARRLVVVNVACYLARATLPNGENAHITVRPPLWWKGMFDSIAVEFPSVAFQLWCSTGWRNVEGFAVTSADEWCESESFCVPI